MGKVIRWRGGFSFGLLTVADYCLGVAAINIIVFVFVVINCKCCIRFSLQKYTSLARILFQHANEIIIKNSSRWIIWSKGCCGLWLRHHCTFDGLPFISTKCVSREFCTRSYYSSSREIVNCYGLIRTVAGFLVDENISIVSCRIPSSASILRLFPEALVANATPLVHAMLSFPPHAAAPFSSLAGRCCAFAGNMRSCLLCQRARLRLERVVSRKA